MNGPEHYREAEKALAYGDDTTSSYLMALVHATLALAAATAFGAEQSWLGDENRSACNWTQVLG